MSGSLVYFPDPALTTPAEPVETFNEDLVALVTDMIRVATEHHGIGLAAPQLGVSLRVIILNLGAGAAVPRFEAFVNPFLATHGRDVETEPEGCLSIPFAVVAVERYRIVTISARNLVGASGDATFRGKLARAAQHELDHLDGRMILDYAPVDLDRLKREMEESV